MNISQVAKLSKDTGEKVLVLKNPKILLTPAEKLFAKKVLYQCIDFESTHKIVKL